MKRRGSGILLHITSLPSEFGVGDLGPAAYRFADFLADAKQSYWQILPLNPTDLIHHNSPYHSTSAFAFNTLLISPELLARDGLLSMSDLTERPAFPAGQVDFRAATEFKRPLLEKAVDAFHGRGHRGYEMFIESHSFWLNDYALFMALKSRFHGKVWSQWPVEIMERRGEALAAAEKELADTIERIKIAQYLFYAQWTSLKHYCAGKGIQIIGDLPIYVEYDSVDVWTLPWLFKLDEHKRPYVVAGVPPDYFSATGQLWGNPVYDWEAMRKHRYQWWVDRMRHNLTLFDFVRIDHFRGLVAYWEVPAGETTAMHGRWVEAPVMDFFTHLHKQFASFPVIAEDLGVITPDVREVMHHYGFPGMKVLVFAFGDDVATNPYVPHNLEKNCIAYTGTHDNNTVRAWIENEASEVERERVFRYLGRTVDPASLPWELIRMLMMSVANTVIIPVQDILGLGGEARMNRPAVGQGNWQWQLTADQMKLFAGDQLREMVEIYGRT